MTVFYGVYRHCLFPLLDGQQTSNVSHSSYEGDLC